MSYDLRSLGIVLDRMGIRQVLGSHTTCDEVIAIALVEYEHLGLLK